MARIIESVQDAEQSALEAVRRFVDVVDGVFPDVSDDGPRRKIIDSTFKMGGATGRRVEPIRAEDRQRDRDALRERQSDAPSSEE